MKLTSEQRKKREAALIAIILGAILGQLSNWLRAPNWLTFTGCVVLGIWIAIIWR